tara:strand:+ start:205 stop:642 length:438 start_codon:yes stop_codon:yes gene_type:complete
MKLSEHLEKFDKYLVETTAAVAAGEFVGTRGQGIDTIFAGPYHPEFGMIKQLLKQQLEDKDLKGKWNDKVTPELEVIFRDIGFNYKFDKLEVLYNKLDFITKSETNMEYAGIDIKYDDNKPHYNKEDFINKSQTNWKVISSNKEE